MESSHLITSPGIAVEPTASGWCVFGDAWRLVRRDWAPLLATLSILWLVWFVPRLLIGALWFGHAWNARSAGTVITALIVAVSAAQAVAVVWLAAGVLRLHLAAWRTGERPPLARAFSAGGRLASLLLEVLIVATPVVALVLLYRTALPNGVLAALPVLAALLLVALGTQPLAVPLIVDRRLTTVAAIAGSAGLMVRRGRPAHLPVIALAAVGTVAAAAACVWPVALSESYTDARSVVGVLASARLGPAALVAFAGVAGCLVGVTLVAALYVRLSQPESAERAGGEDTAAGAASASALPRLWLPLGALAAAALMVLGLAYGAAWVFCPVESTSHPPAGERVTLHNGLSLVAPAGSHAELTAYRQYPAWLPIGENAPTPDLFFNNAGVLGRKDNLFFDRTGAAGAQYVSITSCSSDDAWLLHEAARGTVLARSADGRVTLFGGRGSYGMHLVTRLPGKMAGVLWVVFRTTQGTTWAVQRQNAALRRLWRGLQIEGAPLPVIL